MEAHCRVQDEKGGKIRPLLCLEPLKSTQNQNTNKRADLKVEVRGHTVMIDVMVTNPATSTKINTQQSHLKPGITAARAYNVKLSKYKDVQQSEFRFLPFIIETGGRIHKAACNWLDSLIQEDDDNNITRRLIKSTYRRITSTLMFKQGAMLHRYLEQQALDRT